MSDLTSISSVGLLETGCEDGRASKGHADGRKEERNCPELVLFEGVEFDMGMPIVMSPKPQKQPKLS